MKETLEQLLSLQQRDDAIVALEQEIAELDKNLAGAQAALEVAIANVETVHHATQETRAATHSLETDLQQAEANILKLQGQLNGASSNKEYTALLLKIGTIKAENGKLEERILHSMDAVEERERDEEAARSKQKDAEADLRAAEGRVAELRKEREQALVDMRTARDELAGKVDPEKLRLYERIRTGNRLSGGTAVVEVHGEYCQGCQMGVRPQDIADLMSGSELIICRTCQRILVLVT